MIKINLTEKENELEFSSIGHATHDICVAVTALCSTFIQFVNQKMHDGDISIIDTMYSSGYTKAHFLITANKSKIRSGIDALLIGFELYAHNFPKEVKFIIN